MLVIKPQGGIIPHRKWEGGGEREGKMVPLMKLTFFLESDRPQYQEMNYTATSQHRSNEIKEESVN